MSNAEKTVDEFEDRLIQIAGHAISKVLEVYKRKPRVGTELRKLKLLEEVAQRIEILLLRDPRVG